MIYSRRPRCPVAPTAGAMIKDPKRAMLQQAHKEAQELTKAINADNEEHFTGVATSVPGGKLSVVSWGGRAVFAVPAHVCATAGVLGAAQGPVMPASS